MSLGVTVMLKVHKIAFAAAVGPYFFSSNINAAAISTANLFVLEIAFDCCDALHIVSR